MFRAVFWECWGAVGLGLGGICVINGSGRAEKWTSVNPCLLVLALGFREQLRHHLAEAAQFEFESKV